MALMNGFWGGGVQQPGGTHEGLSGMLGPGRGVWGMGGLGGLGGFKRRLNPNMGNQNAGVNPPPVGNPNAGVNPPPMGNPNAGMNPGGGLSPDRPGWVGGNSVLPDQLLPGVNSGVPHYNPYLNPGSPFYNPGMGNQLFQGGTPGFNERLWQILNPGGGGKFTNPGAWGNLGPVDPYAHG